MNEDVLDAEVKARIPEWQKTELQNLARQRHLKPSHLIREALRLFLDAVKKGGNR